ncbi:Response regulator (plasmid) [Phaeobacter inhibens]|uniref:helix-turn-helix transcriptional regulator n=1 Tax=Phaeobacter inhibens TaxID=221822 RepID=UPI000C9A016C|nr:autoinducer binding domain-containing protein [Phaeobacter inhibens]AUQ92817.1 Response regulator [Phaeobacter inhibens]
MARLSNLFSNYGHTISTQGATKECVTSTYAPEWVDTYFAHGFDRIDPVFRFAAHNRRRTAAAALTPDEMQSPLFEAAAEYGADSNIMITDYIGGSTMVLGGVNPELSNRNLSEAVQACKSLHRRVLMDRLHSLSDKQVDLLELVEMGWKDAEISFELGVSPSAIAQRKRAICNALGVTSFSVAAQIYSADKWAGLICDC